MCTSRLVVSWLTGHGSSATTARGLRLPSVAVLVLLALTAVGCGKPAAPASHRLAGTYIVHGFFTHRSYGASCEGADVGYPDIHQGTTVKVRDDGSALLGTVALEGGTLRKSPLRGKDDDCVFSFSLTVPERDSYRIAVGKRGVVPFSRSEMERSNWKADLTIGAYTMFGGI